MDPKQLVLDKIKENGGWVNTHAHLDRAYTLTEANFNNSYSYLKEKWHLVDEMKRMEFIKIILQFTLQKNLTFIKKVILISL